MARHNSLAGARFRLPTPPRRAMATVLPPDPRLRPAPRLKAIPKATMKPVRVSVTRTRFRRET